MYAGLTAIEHVLTVTVREPGKPVYQKTRRAVNLSGKCVFTGRRYSVTVSRDDFDKYNAGALMQDAFPELSADDREFLISGIAPGGFDQLFKE